MNIAQLIPNDLQSRVQRAGDALSDLEPWRGQGAETCGFALAPFLGGMDEARWWASIATPTEIECFGAACFEMMDLARLPNFLSFVQGRAVA